METQKEFLVIDSYISNLLVKLGYRITGIKPNKIHKERSVFYFKWQEGIEEDFNRLVANK